MVDGDPVMTDQVPQKAFWHKLAVAVLTLLLLAAFGAVFAGLIWQAGKTAAEFDRLDRERAAKAGEEVEPGPAEPPALVPLTD